MKNNLIIKKLIKKKITTSVAESCTGGMLSSQISSIPGCSKIFNCGIVAYSNLAKEKILNVKKINKKKYGAVSAQVCKDMIDGLKKKSQSQLCISTTGIAGPSGGTSLKPVGLIYVGIKFNKYNKIYMLKFNQRFNRKKIQTLTVQKIFKLIDLLI